jgi:hypothetical protein
MIMTSLKRVYDRCQFFGLLWYATTAFLPACEEEKPGRKKLKVLAMKGALLMSSQHTRMDQKRKRRIENKTKLQRAKAALLK